LRLISGFDKRLVSIVIKQEEEEIKLLIWKDDDERQNFKNGFCEISKKCRLI